MAQTKMFSAKSGSPSTVTTQLLTTSAVAVFVEELGVFPDLGEGETNLITLWENQDYETCEYSAKSAPTGAGTLTISRSGQYHSSSSGVAREWPVGTNVARNFTGYDFTAFKTNIEDLATSVDGLASDVSELDGLAGDVAGIAFDLSGLSGDVSTLSSDVSGLSSDVSGFDGRITACENKIDPIIAALIFG